MDPIRHPSVRVETYIEIVRHTVVHDLGSAVVVHIHLCEEEVAVVEGVFFLEHVPRGVDVRHHLGSPLLVDECEIVPVYGRREGGAFAHGKVQLHERLDLGVVRAESEDGYLVLGDYAAHGLNRLVVDCGRRLRPVEIVQAEDW